jgi:hypothetical protein
MKPQTLQLLKKHLDRFKFDTSPEGLNFEHDLSDDEIKEIVESEYGTTLTGSVEELFIAIIKKLIKQGMEHAKKEA